MAKPRRTLALAWRDVPPFSCSVGERVTLMNHFVLNDPFHRSTVARSISSSASSPSVS